MVKSHQRVRRLNRLRFAVASNLAWARHLGDQAFEPFPLVGAWLDRCSYSRPLAPAYGTTIYSGPWKMYHDNEGSKL